MSNDNGQGTYTPFGEILQKRYNRRAMLGGMMKAIPAAALLGTQSGSTTAAEIPAAEGVNEAAKDTRLTFTSIGLSKDDAINVPPGYKVGVLARWGDPILPGAPAFDPMNQTAAAQRMQFGYNVDWMDYYSLPSAEVENPRHGLIAVNHEYTNPELMFRNYPGSANATQAMADIEMAAHGLSVIEVMRDSTGNWSYVVGQFNRRITATTPMELTGPAAGAALMRTSADPTGRQVFGTLNNCAGGKTPWGTVLSGEENFQGYFANRNALPDGPVKDNHTRYGIPAGGTDYPWYRFYDRFDVSKEPNEPFRFGWIVEFDPYNPTSPVRKRTALGRFRHEGCAMTTASSGQVVGYMGDDQVFQCVYKFVSAGKYNPFNRAANENLLDAGTLYAAKFNDDGTGEWLALVHGQNGLTAANGFADQAGVLIDTRGAAARAGATGMDRPEDIEINPVNGKVYVALTNNSSRTDGNKNASNPRANNRWGHIIEITEDNGDHTGTRFFWEIFVLCGDPKNPAMGTFYAGYDPNKVAIFACPDNLAFDSKGNLWVSTDGQPSPTGGFNDGIYAIPTDGDERGYSRQLVSTVTGAEAASLVFNSDETVLFVSVQHPGEGGAWTDDPARLTSRFPDGAAPNKPCIITVTKAEGNPVVGS